MNRRRFVFVSDFALLFSYGYAINLTNGVNVLDESWFLQVVTRVLSGDALYGQVFFGVTPLSVYVTAIPAALLGTEITVIKAVYALCFALTVLVGWQVARQLKMGKTVFTLAMLVYAFPLAKAIYSPLSVLCLLACFSVTLMWYRNPTPRWALAAGIVAGLTFVSKQNVGVYACLAVGMSALIVIGLRRIPDLLKTYLWMSLGCLLTIGLLCLPILLQNSFPQFWDYGFANKTTYLEYAGISYFDEIGRLFSYLTPLTVDGLHSFHVNTAYFIAPATLVLLSFLQLRNPKNKTGYMVLLFAVASFISIFPRADTSHIEFALPLIFIAVAYVWQQCRPLLSKPLYRTLKAAGLLWFAAGLIFLIQPRIQGILDGQFSVSTIPHFHGALMDTDSYEVIDQQSRQLAAHPEIEPIFFVFPNAAFYYLATGFDNPTPFDYPLLTAFGSKGLAQVIDQLSSGMIPAVCFRSIAGAALEPIPLENYIKDHMLPVQDFGVCVEYRRADSSSAGSG